MRRNVCSKYVDNINRFTNRVDFQSQVNFTPFSTTNFDGVLNVNSKANIHDLHFISSEADLTPNGDSTKWLLTSGSYIFKNPFILTKPFEFINTPGQFVGIRILGETIIYLGNPAIALFENTDLQSLLFLQLTNIIVLGGFTAHGSTTMFNFVSTGPAPPVCLINNCQFSNFASLGTLQGFDAVVLNNFSIRDNAQGIHIIDNVNLVSGNLINIQGGDDSVGYRYISVSGSTNINTSVQLSQINFIPTGPNERAIYVSNTLEPNVSISSSTYDQRNISDKSLEPFFDSNGQNETSIYFAVIGNKNIIESRITGVLLGSGSTTTTTINVQDKWYVLQLPGTKSTTSEERISGDTTTSRQLYFGLERTQLTSFSKVNLSTSSGNGIVLETVYFLLRPLVPTTPANATNTFTSVAHGLLDGDSVIFNATTFPTGIVALSFYFVVNKTDDTFQVENVLAGGAVNFTTDGTSVSWNKAIIQGNSSIGEFKSTGFGQIISSTLIDNVVRQDSILLGVRNTSGTGNILCNKYSSRVVC